MSNVGPITSEASEHFLKRKESAMTVKITNTHQELLTELKEIKDLLTGIREDNQKLHGAKTIINGSLRPEYAPRSRIFNIITTDDPETGA